MENYSINDCCSFVPHIFNREDSHLIRGIFSSVNQLRCYVLHPQEGDYALVFTNDRKGVKMYFWSSYCLDWITPFVGTGESEQVQSNWLEEDETSVSYILNKPEIPTVEEITEISKEAAGEVAEEIAREVAEQVSEEKVNTAIEEHNRDENAHADIREDISNLLDLTNILDQSKLSASQIHAGTNITIDEATNGITINASFDSEIFIVVEVLPEEGLPNKIYLVPKSDGGEEDVLDEYIWVNGAWEHVGYVPIDIDLSGYVPYDENGDVLLAYPKKLYFGGALGGDINAIRSSTRNEEGLNRNELILGDSNQGFSLLSAYRPYVNNERMAYLSDVETIADGKIDRDDLNILGDSLIIYVNYDNNLEGRDGNISNPFATLDEALATVRVNGNYVIKVVSAPVTPITNITLQTQADIVIVFEDYIRESTISEIDGTINYDSLANLKIVNARFNNLTVNNSTTLNATLKLKSCTLGNNTTSNSVTLHLEDCHSAIQDLVFLSVTDTYLIVTQCELTTTLVALRGSSEGTFIQSSLYGIRIYDSVEAYIYNCFSGILTNHGTAFCVNSGIGAVDLYDGSVTDLSSTPYSIKASRIASGAILKTTAHLPSFEIYDDKTRTNISGTSLDTWLDSIDHQLMVVRSATDIPNIIYVNYAETVDDPNGTNLRPYPTLQAALDSLEAGKDYSVNVLGLSEDTVINGFNLNVAATVLISFPLYNDSLYNSRIYGDVKTVVGSSVKLCNARINSPSHSFSLNNRGFFEFNNCTFSGTYNTINAYETICRLIDCSESIGIESSIDLLNGRIEISNAHYPNGNLFIGGYGSGVLVYIYNSEFKSFTLSQGQTFASNVKVEGITSGDDLVARIRCDSSSLGIINMGTSSVATLNGCTYDQEQSVFKNPTGLRVNEYLSSKMSYDGKIRTNITGTTLDTWLDSIDEQITEAKESGGSTGNFVTVDTTQNVTGLKTFTTPTNLARASLFADKKLYSFYANPLPSIWETAKLDIAEPNQFRKFDTNYIDITGSLTDDGDDWDASLITSTASKPLLTSVDGTATITARIRQNSLPYVKRVKLEITCDPTSGLVAGINSRMWLTNLCILGNTTRGTHKLRIDLYRDGVWTVFMNDLTDSKSAEFIDHVPHPQLNFGTGATSTDYTRIRITFYDFKFLSNVQDTSTFLLRKIWWFGTYPNKINKPTLTEDLNGNVTFIGNVNSSEGKLATETYVDEHASGGNSFGIINSDAGSISAIKPSDEMTIVGAGYSTTFTNGKYLTVATDVPNATTSTAGLMVSPDKLLLDNISSRYSRLLSDNIIYVDYKYTGTVQDGRFITPYKDLLTAINIVPNQQNSLYKMSPYTIVVNGVSSNTIINQISILDDKHLNILFYPSSTYTDPVVLKGNIQVDGFYSSLKIYNASIDECTLQCSAYSEIEFVSCKIYNNIIIGNGISNTYAAKYTFNSCESLLSPYKSLTIYRGTVEIINSRFPYVDIDILDSSVSGGVSNSIACINSTVRNVQISRNNSGNVKFCYIGNVASDGSFTGRNSQLGILSTTRTSGTVFSISSCSYNVRDSIIDNSRILNNGISTLTTLQSYDKNTRTNIQGTTVDTWLNSIDDLFTTVKNSIPSVPESNVIDVSNMFTTSTQADTSAFMFKRESGRHLIKLHGFDNSLADNDLIIVPVLGFGPQYSSYQASVQTLDGVNYQNYAIKIEQELDKVEGRITVPDGMETFDINYYLHDGTNTKASYYIDTSGVMHPFELENTPIENFSIGSSTDSLIINSQLVLKVDIREIVFGTSYADITTLGNGFCSRLSNLLSIDLSSLRKVESIGSEFLANDYLLSSLDLTNFENLSSIYNFFLHQCRSLKSLDLSPFKNFTSIPYAFLSHCSSLTTLDLTPLKNVKHISSNFLLECRNIISLDISPLRQLTNTNNFLNGVGVKSLDFTGFKSITSIFQSSFSNMPNLEKLVGFNDLSNLATIGSLVLMNCPKLESIDLSGFGNVINIGARFLDSARKLKIISIGGIDWTDKVVNETQLMYEVPNTSDCLLYADSYELGNIFKQKMNGAISEWTIVVQP